MLFSMVWEDGENRVLETFDLRKATNIQEARIIFEKIIDEFNKEEKSLFGEKAKLRSIISVSKTGLSVPIKIN